MVFFLFFTIIHGFLLKKDFPILSKQSYIAARAALASKKQGLYNKFHLSLMEITGRVDEEKVFRTAEKIGLNINQLKKDIKDPEIEEQLIKNREIAKLLGLNGTPAFIISDEIFFGYIDKDDMVSVLNQQ